jgi:hypothetical protein
VFNKSVGKIIIWFWLLLGKDSLFSSYSKMLFKNVCKNIHLRVNLDLYKKMKTNWIPDSAKENWKIMTNDQDIEDGWYYIPII